MNRKRKLELDYEIQSAEIELEMLAKKQRIVKLKQEKAVLEDRSSQTLAIL